MSISGHEGRWLSGGSTLHHRQRQRANVVLDRHGLTSYSLIAPITGWSLPWTRLLSVGVWKKGHESTNTNTNLGDMLAYATHDVPSDVPATIVLITGDTLNDSNFISPISMLNFLDHHVVVVTANMKETRLKASISPYLLFNWYADVVLPRHLGTESVSKRTAALCYARDAWLHKPSPKVKNSSSHTNAGSHHDTLDYASDSDGHHDLGSRAQELPPSLARRFRFLIRCLQFYASTGCPYPTIKLVARSLAGRRATHKDGFASMRACVRQAEAFGIVEVGGQGKDTWVELKTTS